MRRRLVDTEALLLWGWDLRKGDVGYAYMKRRLYNYARSEVITRHGGPGRDMARWDIDEIERILNWGNPFP